MVTNRPNVKANCQIFIKNDLHFYRTDYLVEDAIILKINKEATDEAYIDFKINKFGERASMIQEKELQMRPVQNSHKIEVICYPPTYTKLAILLAAVSYSLRNFATKSPADSTLLIFPIP